MLFFFTKSIKHVTFLLNALVSNAPVKTYHIFSKHFVSYKKIFRGIINCKIRGKL